jgi:hypothetical protein
VLRQVENPVENIGAPGWQVLDGRRDAPEGERDANCNE